MKDFLSAAVAAAALSCLIVGAGCVAESPNTANTNVATTNANVTAMPTPMTSPTVNASANNLPVTLPVLDAMFSDEAFGSELKTKLQLTDEQVSRLRTMSREETGKLREADTDEYPGTTAAARRQADEQIKSVIGEEKAGQLATFVRERWSGNGGEASANSGGATTSGSTTGKMNAVPTDTRIVVNAPAYRMDVFENGQLVKTYKVGIGYPEFPLPTGMRRADTIIFNPTWTPPDEPWVESPSSKVKVGEKVEAGSPLNPLGPIKIPIGLPSLIHGGKSPAKLGTFASHGCVGLTNPQVQDFAQVLGKLGGTQITPEDVANYAKTKTETKNVKLSNAVPVELRYETIVVSDGKLYIYRDVYDRGTNTEENLRAALEAHGISLDQLSEAERGQVMNALKEMARDAGGNPADGQPSASPGTNANVNASANTNNNVSGNKNANSKNANVGDEKVTRTIKGRKEVVIQLAALAGKGYPAPVGIDAKGGTAKPAAAQASGNRR